MNNFQVTVPRYRENPLIKPFSMLCPGISQNTKHHQLTLYKGQIWRGKSYLELCNHNVLTVAYDPVALNPGDIMEQNGELYVPSSLQVGFIRDDTQIPWDSEILQSFAELSNIIKIIFHKAKESKFGEYQLYASSAGRLSSVYIMQQVPPTRYFSRNIWTKEGFKIGKNQL